MFSRLPQKLPFNLLGDEVKLAFRSQPGGIAKLASVRVSDCGRIRPSRVLTCHEDYTGRGCLLVPGKYASLCHLGRPTYRRGSQYFVLFDTASDVFTLISPHDSELPWYEFIVVI